MLKIGGLQKNSFIDYPGKISCVIFLSGCNYACPYCHNPELARGEVVTAYTPEQIFDFLSGRKGLIDGVVISGGEPTLQHELFDLCEAIHQQGFPIKLDTNGSRPAVLKELIERRLLDYIAMDIKTDPNRYAPLFHSKNHSDDIMASVEVIIGSGLSHEFRTTCIKSIMEETVLETISRLIDRADRYVLQNYHPNRVLNPAFFFGSAGGFSEAEMQNLKLIAEKHVRQVIIR
ncbi:MAG: anaerobic ribonucleoside-triphosphate reductase activating protein [Desulfatirhabdiaceae bacterium]